MAREENMQARDSIMLQAFGAIRRWKDRCLLGQRKAPCAAAPPPEVVQIDSSQSDLLLVQTPKWWQRAYRKPTVSRPVITLVTCRYTGTVLHWSVRMPPNTNESRHQDGV
ncbi:hypothetical protein LMG31506_06331 [Cupriavidus yeoncheonensis]|uniref:Uncharacterized protein n=1 Tax=Cupriavidus yeoncheonensis TaxID=1462994 RepID=A0A916N0Y3_9BURK|nr:hypothetical protein LMG31506_06331 [Cupriavidus yeoncheonensis]